MHAYLFCQTSLSKFADAYMHHPSPGHKYKSACVSAPAAGEDTWAAHLKIYDARGDGVFLFFRVPVYATFSSGLLEKLNEKNI